MNRFTPMEKFGAYTSAVSKADDGVAHLREMVVTAGRAADASDAERSEAAKFSGAAPEW